MNEELRKFQLGQRPKYWIRTMDHPCSNGRTPVDGERQWNLDFEGEDGLVHRVHVGEFSRGEMLKMLSDENAKSFPVEEKTDAG